MTRSISLRLRFFSDAVEDARAAVRYMKENAQRLQLDTTRIMAFGGSAGAVTVAQLLYALPDGTPMPSPPPDPETHHCLDVLKAKCPLKMFPSQGGYEACLACSREHAAAPLCKPLARVAYCNGTVSLDLGSETAANVSCGIALSGALTPGSIAAKQVTAASSSSPYLDFHGTEDHTVPYDWANANGSNITWGDAVDTKIWLDAHFAPNFLTSIPGAGHVPFDSLFETPYNTTYFGFLLQSMRLDTLQCPFLTLRTDDE
eukprot:SAG31_NODE_6379_length_2039_cov_3.442784_3_plen_259_part_00